MSGEVSIQQPGNLEVGVSVERLDQIRKSLNCVVQAVVLLTSSIDREDINPETTMTIGRIFERLKSIQTTAIEVSNSFSGNSDTTSIVEVTHVPLPILPKRVYGDELSGEVDTDRAQRGRQSSKGLKLSFDRKVSPEGVYQESRRRWIATIPNSFGLPAHKSCPGETPFCRSCYAVGSERSKGVEELVNHNFDLLLETKDDPALMKELLIDAILAYEVEANLARLPLDERIFRIHWDGDFFSEAYAEAWAETIKLFPHIKFWAYTRSFTGGVNVVPKLSGIENLSLYLSTDMWNVEKALKVTDEYPDVLLAYSTRDYVHGRALAGSRRVIVCPENNGTLDLMTDGRGACVDCMICPDSKADVIFSTSHKDFADQEEPVEVPVTLGRTA